MTDAIILIAALVSIGSFGVSNLIVNHTGLFGMFDLLRFIFERDNIFFRVTKLNELFSCTYCTNTWVSIILTALAWVFLGKNIPWVFFIFIFTFSIGVHHILTSVLENPDLSEYFGDK
jgi:hypothetical protein